MTITPRRSGDIWARKQRLVIGAVVRGHHGWRPVMDAAEALPAGVDPAVLGSTIRKVLAASLLIPRPPPGPDDFDDQLGRRFGLKNGKSLYAGVRLLSLDERDGWLTCTPMRHRRGFDFDAFPAVWREQQPVRVASDAPDAEWGVTALKALRLSV